jgi:Xaa-Pro aminopeptidase
MYKRVIKKVKKSNFDALIIHNPININWMCNLNNYYIPSILLATNKRIFIFTQSRNIDAFRSIYPQHEIIYGTINDLYKKCENLNLNRIGVEGNFISTIQYKILANLFNKFELILTDDFIEDLRMIKTSEEIRKIQRAVSLSDDCFIEFLNYLKHDITEIEAKNIFREIIFKKGADDLSFDILISSGPRSFLPHSASTNKVIKQGELILIDFGVVLDGYCSDTTRTVAIGFASDKQKNIYNIVLEAQKNALRKIKAGVTLNEADSFARSVIKLNLDEGCFDYGLGHGVGRVVHEKPRMHPDKHQIMNSGMVVSVEPGVYIKDWGGIRIEDLLVVKDNAPGEILTKAPKQLII